ncbi:trypsin-like peptidase domain-containing protein [Paenibacillus sp. GP183]|uniref:S1C family serine protease n=1 Tax=Paenibacillus sp. GP183 TaxID=1882751 RepID=UPI0008948662|nr:trypsin-like peptidase domain-containing protein [Paenibacillus sp. GP183]SEC09474.1 serine protease, S1-C subfamily, contains C-terminal PDZ domain [Paenibacillus sp. GP183]
MDDKERGYNESRLRNLNKKIVEVQIKYKNGRRQMSRPSPYLNSLGALMVGVIIVGTLMFVSNKLHLFTGGVHAHATENASSLSSLMSTNNGRAKTASLDIVRPNSFSEIAKLAVPAVVKVETKMKSQISNQSDRQVGSLVPNGIGTGFIFEKSGYILTNEHVVDGADEIDVTIQGYNQPFKAKLLGSSYDLDLAALKIEGDKDFPTLPFGRSDDTQVGDWVIAIGNPYDFDYTVTKGVLSAKERPISIQESKGTRNYKHLLQTDAKINPGNSGGPLLNLNGEVIGINTAVSTQAQGIGFAIPTSTISQVLDNLKNNVKIPKEPIPYIGVYVADIQKDWLGDLQLDNTDGALVQNVSPRTPAFKAGIRQYDVIVSVNGDKVTNATDLTKKVQANKIGDKLTLSILRSGQKQDVTVVVGDRNTNSDFQQQ